MKAYNQDGSKRDPSCRACQLCSEYGFGCIDPMTQKELDTDLQFFAEIPRVNGIGPVPDCWNREREE